MSATTPNQRTKQKRGRSFSQKGAASWFGLFGDSKPKQPVVSSVLPSSGQTGVVSQPNTNRPKMYSIGLELSDGSVISGYESLQLSEIVPVFNEMDRAIRLYLSFNKPIKKMFVRSHELGVARFNEDPHSFKRDHEQDYESMLKKQLTAATQPPRSPFSSSSSAIDYSSSVDTMNPSNYYPTASSYPPSNSSISSYHPKNYRYQYSRSYY